MNNQKVCAVVVTYNIGKKYIENFISVYSQVNKVIIVDNHSDNETVEVLEELQKTYSNIEIKYLNENLGIGGAQNIGIKKALEENFEWILLLDHDSRLSPNMIKNMLEYYEKLPEIEKKRIGIIAPSIYDINLREYLDFNCITWGEKGFKMVKYRSSEVIQNAIIISSGSMIRTTVFKEIGLMKKHYFMDYTDVEFCIRLIDNKFKTVILSNVIFYHALGNSKRIKIFGQYLTSCIPNYTPIRYYYLYRNNILLLRDANILTNKKVGFLPYNFMFLTKLLFMTIFYEKNKREKMYYITKGLYDGLRGKYGKLE